jgi:hypothetical protein
VSGEDPISHVVVAAAGTRRLVSLVKRGCARINGTAGRVTIVSLTTVVERIAARCLLSETWVPMLESEDLVAGRAPAMAEALLACPSTIDVEYQVLVDWTTGSVVDTVLRAAPDAVVLDTRLLALRRALGKHFSLQSANEEMKSRDVLFVARSQPSPS